MRRVISVVFFFLGLALPALSEGIKPQWAIPEGLKWEAVNGYPMSYREAGAGPQTIVLVHGAMSDSRTWFFQMRPLSETNRVIAVHLRHYYPEKWDGNGSGFSVQQHAADVAALVKKLKLGKVHLVGFSRGGSVVIEVAKSDPDIIRTLVLVDGSIEMPLPETPEFREAATFTAQLNKTLQENLRKGDPDKAAEVFLDTLNSPGYWAKLADGRKRTVLDNIHTGLGEGGYRPVTTCDDLRKLSFPTLLLTGEKSPKKFEAMYSEMRKCGVFPATIVVPGAGHAMHSANPEFFNKHLLEFVAKH